MHIRSKAEMGPATDVSITVANPAQQEPQDLSLQAIAFECGNRPVTPTTRTSGTQETRLESTIRIPSKWMQDQKILVASHQIGRAATNGQFQEMSSLDRRQRQTADRSPHRATLTTRREAACELGRKRNDRTSDDLTLRRFLRPWLAKAAEPLAAMLPALPAPEPSRERELR